jgi:hypothetical protein
MSSSLATEKNGRNSMSGDVPHINLQAQRQVTNKRTADRPKNEPADRDEFKKVMAIDPDETNDKPKQWKKEESSIFDLAKKTQFDKALKDETKPSLLDLAGKTKGGDSLLAAKNDELAELDSRTGDEIHLDEILHGKKEAKGESEQHQQSSHIVPIIQENTVQIEPIFAETSSAQKKQADLLALVKEIVAAMQEVHKSDRTEFILTLKNGIFAGAQLQITEFAHAKGEFNIDFFGLKAEAKALVDSAQNQNALKAEMEHQGFVVHKFTTTEETLKTFVATADPKEEKREQDQPSDEQNPKKKKKQ